MERVPGSLPRSLMLAALQGFVDSSLVLANWQLCGIALHKVAPHCFQRPCWRAGCWITGSCWAPWDLSGWLPCSAALWELWGKPADTSQPWGPWNQELPWSWDLCALGHLKTMWAGQAKLSTWFFEIPCTWGPQGHRTYGPWALSAPGL